MIAKFGLIFFGTKCDVNSLNPTKTVFSNIEDISNIWDYQQIRTHLNNFLFSKNEQVNALASTLSGGEKARLCLAMIAANPPSLFLLDEITNNLDITTKEHVIQVLTKYPGALVVISHDYGFLENIRINSFYKIENNRLIS